MDITSVLEIQRSVTLSPNVLISDWVHLSKYKDLNLLEMQMLEIWTCNICGMVHWFFFKAEIKVVWIFQHFGKYSFVVDTFVIVCWVVVIGDKRPRDATHIADKKYLFTFDN